MPEEYFKKTGKTQSGGGPHIMKTYGQGKNPIMYKDTLKKIKAGAKGVVAGIKKAWTKSGRHGGIHSTKRGIERGKEVYKQEMKKK
tara:strand:+ start:182 stop:439 length:258 start_codon:yes stop_codon:yes gene_type:complete